MNPNEVIRWPEPGQFWASIQPTALHLFKAVGEVATGGPGCISSVRWTPEKDEEEFHFFVPEPTHFRYLWFGAVVQVATTKDRRLLMSDAVPGDIWLYNKPNGDQALFFVGPFTNQTQTHIIADHSVAFTIPDYQYRLANDTWESEYKVPMMHLYQPGAGRKAPPVKTAWDAISQPDEL